MLQSLMYKDLRLTAPVFAAAALFLFVPYLSTFTLAKAMAHGPFPWAEAVVAGAHFAQWLLVFTGALLGGNALAREREDGSCLFEMALPIRGRQVLFSKLIVTLAAFEILWIISVLTVRAAAPFAAPGYRTHLPGAVSMTHIAALSFLVLGVSWAWSARLSRPIIAAVAGLATCGFLGLVTALATRWLPVASVLPSALFFPVLAIVGGALGIAAGCALFLRSTESRGTAQRGKRSVLPGGHLSREHVLPGSASSRPGRRIAALVWKDWRLLRMALIGGIVLLVFPYAYVAVASLLHGRTAEALARASTQSLWLCCGVFAVWGGYLIAAERASGAEDFIQALPGGPGHRTVVKLLVSALPCLALLMVDTGVAWAAHRAAFLPSPIDPPDAGFADMTWSLLLWQPSSLLFGLPAVGAPLVCFGVGFLVSVKWGKPALGIAAGAISTAASMVLWVVLSTLVQDVLPPFPAALSFAVAGLAVACACAGWGYRIVDARSRGNGR